MKSSGFEHGIADFIKDNKLLGSAPKVLLAVSGGADSTAMLHALCALRDRGLLDAELTCGHINHRLRGEQADEDERFVAEQAEKLGLELSVRRVDVRRFARRANLSIETAARELRIESLLDIAAETGADRIATAHQMDDNAETIVQRLARGTGIRGLGGIWPVRAFSKGDIRFIRPMLGVTRQEVIAYLEERKLQWREDHTNAEFAYRRNYIRHRLLPALQADCTRPLAEQLSELSRAARGYYALVCHRADSVWADSAAFDEERVALDCAKLLAESQPVRVELVRLALDSLRSGQRDIKQQHYERVMEWAEHSKSGRRVDLPDGFLARREYENLIIEAARIQSEKAGEQGAEIPIPGKTIFAGHIIKASILDTEKAQADSCFNDDAKTVEKYVERFDLAKVKPPVLVRTRRDGDRFVPLGLQAEKKIGKFLTDARIGADLRRKVLVVEDREKIIWLWPIRMTDLAKITGRTLRILQIEIASSPKFDEGKETEK